MPNTPDGPRTDDASSPSARFSAYAGRKRPAWLHLSDINVRDLDGPYRPVDPENQGTSFLLCRDCGERLIEDASDAFIARTPIRCFVRSCGTWNAPLERPGA